VSKHPKTCPGCGKFIKPKRKYCSHSCWYEYQSLEAKLRNKQEE
jgi:hypothetical protein